MVKTRPTTWCGKLSGMQSAYEKLKFLIIITEIEEKKKKTCRRKRQEKKTNKTILQPIRNKNFRFQIPNLSHAAKV